MHMHTHTGARMQKYTCTQACSSFPIIVGQWKAFFLKLWCKVFFFLVSRLFEVQNKSCVSAAFNQEQVMLFPSLSPSRSPSVRLPLSPAPSQTRRRSGRGFATPSLLLLKWRNIWERELLNGTCWALSAWHDRFAGQRRKAAKNKKRRFNATLTMTDVKNN